MKCEYSAKCKNESTHKVQTKIGDFVMCQFHARKAGQTKECRYIQPLPSNRTNKK